MLVGTSRYFNYHTTVRYIDTILEVGQGQKIITQVQTVLTLLVDAETGERGYVITRQERFLDPYREAISRLKTETDKLEALIRNSPFRRQHFSRLRAGIQSQIRFLDENVSLVRQGSHNEAVQRVISGEGKRLLDANRLLLSQLRRAEENDLARQLLEVESMEERNKRLNLAGVVILALLFAGGLLTIISNINQQDRLREQLRKENQMSQELNRELHIRLRQLYDAQEIAQVGSFRTAPGSNTFTGTPELFRIAGWPTELAGKPADTGLFYNSLSPDDARRILSYTGETTPDRQSLTATFRMRTGGGDQKQILIKARIRAEGEAAPVMEGTVLDITARKRFEEELQQLNEELRATNEELSSTVEELTAAGEKIQQYNLILEEKNLQLERLNAEYTDLYENAPVGYHSLDAQGRIVKVNNTELQWLGYTREEMTDKPVAQFLPAHQAEDLKRLTPELISKGMVSGVEREFRRKDGTVMTLLVNARAEYDEEDNFVRIRSTLTNFTELKAARQLLAERTAQLEQTNRDLEAFAFTISHDLKAPLRVVVGFTGMLKEEYAGKLDDEGMRLIKVIEKNSIQMGRLVDDLLSFARLGRTTVAKATVDTQSLVQEVLTEQLTGPGSEKYQVQVGSLPVVTADPRLLRQVWSNLIGNAVKFSAAVNAPAIGIEASRQEQEVVFTIRDNGAGYDPAHRDNLFRVFRRLHSADEFEGSGVGLAIVHRIISWHHGRIWSESSPGAGATFHFSLPGQAGLSA